MIIKGKAYTNLDMYKDEKWPTEYAEVPKIGSTVKSQNGKVLKVIDITHCQSIAGSVFVEIELDVVLCNNKKLVSKG